MRIGTLVRMILIHTTIRITLTIRIQSSEVARILLNHATIMPALGWHDYCLCHARSMPGAVVSTPQAVVFVPQPGWHGSCYACAWSIIKAGQQILHS